jgi:hypothetical protein
MAKLSLMLPEHGFNVRAGSPWWNARVFRAIAPGAWGLLVQAGFEAGTQRRRGTAIQSAVGGPVFLLNFLCRLDEMAKNLTIDK